MPAIGSLLRLKGERMIGQTDLLEKIKSEIDDDLFPHFSIFIGPKGSGKNLLMRQIAEYLEGYQVHELPDVSIDTIRDMISEATSKANSGAKIVYIIKDSEQMSIAAKNSILKITEEPPKGAYILMSVVNEANLLDTIKNRAALYRMRPYSEADKLAYLDVIGASLDAQDEALVLKTANTLSDVETLVKLNPGKLKACVRDFISDIVHDASPSILLNMSKDVAFKEDADGYPLELFMRMCCEELAERTFEIDDRKKALMYSRLISKTVEMMGELRYNSVSKEHTFDMWILDCRKIVRKWKSEN